MSTKSDQNEAYRQTQFQIYNLQETILNSTRNRDLKKEINPSSDPKNRSGHELRNGRDMKVLVSSENVLKYVEDNYSSNRRNLGALRYNRWKTGSFDGLETTAQDNVYPYDYTRYELPPPFLPLFGSDNINCIVTVQIEFEEIQCLLASERNSRVENQEIWGTDIYTDDSDILLVLKHCGVILGENTTAQTPANYSNPNNVKGLVPPESIEFDVSVEILLLPPLQKYSASKRHGVKSREWTSWHDGLSYGIYGVTITPRDKSISKISSDERVTTIKW
ncbi:LAFE_0E08284g1_1 [Lachancea fermentati]|uniref:LAFE_0E08284g1_1 n=1 Tax=Lachancea fermentati TaxID=4955 RepID=A0A1G4MDH7_LACFM|nr:LAFE_0E08284g1_1 [Lachancea fermentati]